MNRALVICAHGTGNPDGQQSTLDIAKSVAERLPEVVVTCAYVDVQSPLLDDEVARLVATGHDVTIVPILLTVGYHIEVDVARVVLAHPGRVVSSGPLGPHRCLAAALLARLRAAGVPDDQPVVVGIAGSSRPESVPAGKHVAWALQRLRGGPVTTGFLAGAGTRVADAVSAARAEHGAPVAVASYLMGRGFFHTKLAAVGADVVTEPLGPHPYVIDLVVRQFLGA